MTTYLVGTQARFVLVEADNEDNARERGQAALHALYADISDRVRDDTPIPVRTVRPATNDEIAEWRRHDEIRDRHRAMYRG
jgi:hypothetical protein